MKTALVSGANGFIGQHMVAELLRRNVEVYAVVTDEKAFSDLKNPHLHVITAFFADYPSLHEKIAQPIDVAFHFAWAGLNGPILQDYSLQLQDIDASMVLLNEVVKMGGKRFVLASTMNTLEARRFLAEGETFAKPRYTLAHSGSKMLAEIYLKVYGHAAGIKVNTALIAMAYGPGNYSKMVTNVAINKLLDGVPVDLVTGNNRYDLIYVDDIARAFCAIAERGVDLKTYYVGHRESRTFKELFTEIGQIINPKVELRFGTYPDDNDLDYSLIDTDALYKDTGWKPEADFVSSIKKTASFIQQSGLKFY
jgi:nucleoside-diphosphate-sugar epimerase